MIFFPLSLQLLVHLWTLKEVFFLGRGGKRPKEPLNH
uniref:Uncharacterized protein n=1 Tax=Rhizophora mucronata TaxID=61149 RepID=A0A2P2QY23_RHIMU